MNRIEVLTKLKELEENKVILEGLLNDVSDYYTKEVNIVAYLETSMFLNKREYVNGSSINVNKLRFEGYLKQEIEGIEHEIQILLGGLV